MSVSAVKGWIEAGFSKTQSVGRVSKERTDATTLEGSRTSIELDNMLHPLVLTVSPLLLLALSPPMTVSSLARQLVNSQADGDEPQTQIRNHLHRLVEDVSTIVTYFEMDNSSVVVELARQVAELRRGVVGLNRNMAEIRQEIRNLTQMCDGKSPGIHRAIFPLSSSRKRQNKTTAQLSKGLKTLYRTPILLL